MNKPVREFTIFVTETITREAEYVVRGVDEQDASESFERGEIVDSWYMEEEIDDVVIHRVVEVEEE